jgi:hypothetical protein
MAEPSWFIYYSDGSTFSSDDGAWEDAPGWDCQVVLYRDPITKWGIRHQGDYYRLAGDGTVVAMDFVGLIDYVVEMLGVVKVGRMLSQAEFARVYQRAVEDRLKLQRGD